MRDVSTYSSVIDSASESAYANSITVYRRVNSDLSLEMCFHNVTDVMNGTRLHFFYSDLHCRPNGIQHESSRTYIKSMQLVVMNPAGIHNNVTCTVLDFCRCIKVTVSYCLHE